MRSLLAMLALVVFALPTTAAPNFDDTIAPLFISKCLDCHSGPDAKGKLDLSRKDATAQSIQSGELWRRISDNEMPPKKPLAETEKQLLKAWLDGGAKWGTDPIDPFARSSDARAGKDWWALRPLKVEPGSIDTFIAAKLTQHSLTRSPSADPRTQLRRVSFDLIGLPPTPEEIEAFEKNPTDAEYRKFVEKLLASSHYGERWARHWLDLVRYGESDGFERNEPRLTAWHYRDWVIAALNADMPYDRFVTLQLAGDVLEPKNPDAVKATGFLVAGIHNTVVGTNPIMRETARQDELEDIIAAVGQTFLGLTVQCARCHDHKYDPIPQTDYYKLAASLGGVHHGERVLEPDRAKVYAVSPKSVPKTHRLARGNVEQPRELVVSASLGLLSHTPYSLTAETAEGERRRKVAEWIASRENPLFARVIVNRLWHHHFGTGIVATPSDFGFNGSRPTHPELLDLLAGKLIESGWSLKLMHRLIVTSATYRQASRGVANNRDADNRWLGRRSPTRLDAESLRDAILFTSGQLNTSGGGPSFRDVRTYTNNGTTFYDPIDPVGKEFHRRTIYRFSPRGERSALLETFDCPDPSALTPRRQVTTTPLQALALWNNSFVLRMAEQFANRVETECAKAGDSSTTAKVHRAYRLALGRSPNEAEQKLAGELVEKHTLKSFARVLFNCNEFVIVD
jgi:hypothetical protein